MDASKRYRRRSLGVLVAVVGLVFTGAGLAASQAEPSSPLLPKDRLQGQVPLEDQESGRSLRPYRDNMRLVGQNDIERRGMNGNLGWIDDCAYVSSYYGGDDPLAGLAIVDASNPKRPQLTDILPGTPGTRESQVEANEARRMVVVMPFSSSTVFGDPPGPTLLQIYQAAEDDCTDLTLMGVYDFGDIVTHEHRISADGNTVYATVNSSSSPGDALQVVDVSDMANPALLTTWDLFSGPDMPNSTIHDLDVSPDGTRAYVNLGYEDSSDVDHEGLAILDTSEVADRAPDPEIEFISKFEWGPPENQGLSHSAQLANIAGRQYIIAEDEVFNREGCPWGWARIIDVTDEEHPLQISTIRLEISQRRNCDIATRDDAMYSSHYLGVDSVENTSMVFFTWYSSGLRAYDIRDPYNPKEIGYYIPPGRTDTVLPVREVFNNLRVDYTYSFVRYRPETGHIWFNSVHNGFQIVELVKGLEQLDRPANR